MEDKSTNTSEKADLKSTLLFLFLRIISMGSSWTEVMKNWLTSEEEVCYCVHEEQKEEGQPDYVVHQGGC